MTKWADFSFENRTADSAVEIGNTYEDGTTLNDRYGPGYGTQYYRSGIRGCHGNICLEMDMSSHDTDADTYQALHYFDLATDLTPTTDGSTTYYVACIVRFETVGGNDIWNDSGSYLEHVDKLFDMHGDQFRYDIHAGWNGMTATPTDHKFTLMLWGADSEPAGNQQNWYNAFDSGVHDRTFHNVSPYSQSNPYLCSYNAWYSIVMALKSSTTDTGSIGLYLNGNLVIYADGYKTCDPSPTVDNIIWSGTMGQSSYVLKAHKRYIDHVMLTDTWQDILDGGYLANPEAAICGKTMVNVKKVNGVSTGNLSKIDGVSVR